MARKNPAAMALGKKGGKSTSDAKKATARANGKKGGRPLTFMADCGHLTPKSDFWKHTFNGRTACGPCATKV